MKCEIVNVIPKKGLITDLDGTLWRGTLLEGDTPVFDERVRSLIEIFDQRGILQSVASRNRPECTCRLLLN